LKTFAIIPVKRFENGKSRLGAFLNVRQRVILCELLLERTLKILKTTSSIHEIVIVSNDKTAKQIGNKYGAIFLEEDRDSGVNSAVILADKYCRSANAYETVVVPTDLPLVLPEDIDIVCASAMGEQKCLVVCPSYKYDGSNVLLRKPGMLIKTYYEENSFRRHILAAIRKSAKVKVLFIDRLMMDIDTPQDVENLEFRSESNDATLSFLKKSIKKKE
jgi:2-phospho-L-lactate/phosphoenolpyruvate guanylyltransferase